MSTYYVIFRIYFKKTKPWYQQVALWYNETATIALATVHK